VGRKAEIRRHKAENTHVNLPGPEEIELLKMSLFCSSPLESVWRFADFVMSQNEKRGVDIFLRRHENVGVDVDVEREEKIVKFLQQYKNGYLEPMLYNFLRP
jgi:hypothetical protein